MNNSLFSSPLHRRVAAIFIVVVFGIVAVCGLRSNYNENGRAGIIRREDKDTFSSVERKNNGSCYRRAKTNKIATFMVMFASRGGRSESEELEGYII